MTLLEKNERRLRARRSSSLRPLADRTPPWSSRRARCPLRAVSRARSTCAGITRLRRHSRPVRSAIFCVVVIRMCTASIPWPSWSSRLLAVRKDVGCRARPGSGGHRGAFARHARSQRPVRAEAPRVGAPFRRPSSLSGTSPNACAGECAIGLRLTGPSFAVGGSLHGGLEALSVARDLGGRRRCPDDARGGGRPGGWAPVLASFRRRAPPPSPRVPVRRSCRPSRAACAGAALAGEIPLTLSTARTGFGWAPTGIASFGTILQSSLRGL